MLSRESLRVLQTYRPHRTREFSGEGSVPPVIFNSVCVATYTAESNPEELEEYGFYGVREKTEDEKFKNKNARPKTSSLDLLKLLGTSGGAFSYRKPKFPASTIRFRSGKNNVFTIQVFSGGKCPVVGASSVEQVVATVQQFRLYLRDRGINVRTGEISMSNVVCSGEVGYCIDIEKFQQFDPIGNVKIKDSFPGIMRTEYTEHGVEMRFLIFDSGKYIVMGLPDVSDEAAREAFELIEPLMRANKTEGVKVNPMDEAAYRRAQRIACKPDALEEVFSGGKPNARAQRAPRKRKRDSSVYTREALKDLATLKELHK